MHAETETTIAAPTTKAAVRQSARSLAESLKEMPEFQTLQEAARAINHDEEVQRLLQEMQTHRTALQQGRGSRIEHLSAIRRLQAELDEQGSVGTYRQAEQAVQALLQAVDGVVSEAAGIDFAANAKRSCCG
jgi:cell fate (sporulation/competence/biofilm development) regulator YlbF (YheA/YmcA/DUF963 family)